jgi:hypothetical protein
VHFATVQSQWSPRPLETLLQGQDAEDETLGGVDSGSTIHSRPTVINIKI